MSAGELYAYINVKSMCVWSMNIRILFYCSRFVWMPANPKSWCIKYYYYILQNCVDVKSTCDCQRHTHTVVDFISPIFIPSHFGFHFMWICVCVCVLLMKRSRRKVCETKNLLKSDAHNNIIKVVLYHHIIHVINQ